MNEEREVEVVDKEIDEATITHPNNQ